MDKYPGRTIVENNRFRKIFNFVQCTKICRNSEKIQEILIDSKEI